MLLLDPWIGRVPPQEGRPVPSSVSCLQDLRTMALRESFHSCKVNKKGDINVRTILEDKALPRIHGVAGREGKISLGED